MPPFRTTCVLYSSSEHRLSRRDVIPSIGVAQHNCTHVMLCSWSNFGSEAMASNEQRHGFCFMPIAQNVEEANPGVIQDDSRGRSCHAYRHMMDVPSEEYVIYKAYARKAHHEEHILRKQRSPVRELPPSKYSHVNDLFIIFSRVYQEERHSHSGKVHVGLDSTS